MIKFMCPYCNNEIEVDNEYAGGVGACPYCNKDIRIPIPKRRFSNPQRGIKRQLVSQETSVEQSHSPVLCFLLGFFLWLLGVLIAAIVDKAYGVKKALLGMVVSILIVISIIAIPTIIAYKQLGNSVSGISMESIFRANRNGLEMWMCDKKKVPQDLQEVYSSTYMSHDYKTDTDELRPYIYELARKDKWGNDLILEISDHNEDEYGGGSVNYILRSKGPDGIAKTKDDQVMMYFYVF